MQIDFPPTLPDFSQAHLTNARDVFPESRPATRPQTLAEKLADARLEMHAAGAEDATRARCEGLILEFSALEERILEFLAEHRQAHLSRLQARRADLWAKCRSTEDEKKNLLLEIGRLNGRLNAQAAELSALHQKAADGAVKPFDTAFPNAGELAAWNEKRAAVQSEHAVVEQRFRELQRQLQFAQHEHNESARALAESVDQLRAVDSELNEYRKKQ
jgi:chromosome segregation ATPase